jgi:hypothetical protein
MDNQFKTDSNEAQTSGVESVGRAAGGESRTCHNYWCNYTTNESLTRCPKCGRHLITPQTFKLLGWALLFLGGLLALGAVSLTILVAPGLAGVRGGTSGRLFILGVFGFLLAVGLTFMAGGLWQVLSGKRSQSLTTFAIALLIALAIIVAIGRAIL